MVTLRPRLAPKPAEPETPPSTQRTKRKPTAKHKDITNSQDEDDEGERLDSEIKSPKKPAARAKAKELAENRKEVVPALETSTLYQMLRNYPDRTEDAVAKWYERLGESGAAAVAEIIELVFRSARPDIAPGNTVHDLGPMVTVAVIVKDIPDETVSRLCETLGADSANANAAPLLKKSVLLLSKDREAKKFQTAYDGFWRQVVIACPEDVLFETDAFDTIIGWLQRMSVCPSRPLRYSSSLSSYRILDGLIGVLKRIETQLAGLEAQIDTEQAKRAKASPAKSKSPGNEPVISKKEGELSAKLETLKQQKGNVVELMENIYNGVFVLRYRDVSPEIRSLSIAASTHWAVSHQQSYLNEPHLKYLGWLLNDKVASVRQVVLDLFPSLFGENDDIYTDIEMFWQRYAPRLVEMCRDVDPEAGRKSIEVCTKLLGSGHEELFAEEQMEEISSMMLFGSTDALREAAAAFFLTWKGEGVEESDDLEQLRQQGFKASETERSVELIRAVLEFVLGEVDEAKWKRACELAFSALDAKSRQFRNWQAYKCLLLPIDLAHGDMPDDSLATPSSSRKKGTKAATGATPSRGTAASAAHSLHMSVSRASTGGRSKLSTPVKGKVQTQNGGSSEASWILRGNHAQFCATFLAAACDSIYAEYKLTQGLAMGTGVPAKKHTKKVTDVAYQLMSREICLFVTSLLEHFKAEPKVLKECIRIVGELDISQFKLKRWENQLERLISILADIAMNSGTDDALCNAAVSALSVLAKSHHSLSKVASEALSSLSEDASRSIHTIARNAMLTSSSVAGGSEQAVGKSRRRASKGGDGALSYDTIYPNLVRSWAVLKYSVDPAQIGSWFEDILSLLIFMRDHKSPGWVRDGRVASNILFQSWLLFVASLSNVTQIKDVKEVESKLADLAEQKTSLFDSYKQILESGFQRFDYETLSVAINCCASGIVLCKGVYEGLAADRADVALPQSFVDQSKLNALTEAMISQFVQLMLYDTFKSDDDEEGEEEGIGGEEIVPGKKASEEAKKKKREQLKMEADERQGLRIEMMTKLTQVSLTSAISAKYRYAPIMFLNRQYFGEVSDIARTFHAQIRNRLGDDRAVELELLALQQLAKEGDEAGVLLKSLATTISQRYAFGKQGAELAPLCEKLVRFCLADERDLNREFQYRMDLLEHAGVVLASRITKTAAVKIWDGIQSILPDTVLETLEKQTKWKAVKLFRNALLKESGPRQQAGGVARGRAVAQRGTVDKDHLEDQYNPNTQRSLRKQRGVNQEHALNEEAVERLSFADHPPRTDRGSSIMLSGSGQLSGRSLRLSRAFSTASHSDGMNLEPPKFFGDDEEEDGEQDEMEVYRNTSVGRGEKNTHAKRSLDDEEEEEEEKGGGDSVDQDEGKEASEKQAVEQPSGGRKRRRF